MKLPRPLSASQSPSMGLASVGGASAKSLAAHLYGSAVVDADQAGLGVLLTIGPYRLLFDCGAAVPDQLYATDAVSTLDFAFCSHAHGDHGAGFWELHQARPELPILASIPTAYLLPLNWPEEEASSFCRPLSWNQPHPLSDDLSVTLFPAGHLPGAAVIVVTYRPASASGAPETSDAIQPIQVAYLGDCFLTSTRCADGLDLEPLRGLKPALLIAEGTYGTVRHPRRRQQENVIVEQLLAALAQGDSILLPLSTIGLAQELLVLLRSHHRCTGQDLDIWVDEPIARGCDRYLDLLSEMPQATQNFARHQALFWDERVKPRVHRLSSPRDLGLSPQPSIVLVHPEANWSQFLRRTARPWQLWLPKEHLGDAHLNSGGDTLALDGDDILALLATLPFTHQSARSLRSLQTLLQGGQLSLHYYQLTDHCDGGGTTQLIHNLRPQHLMLVHGRSQGALEDLSCLQELRSRYCVHLPEPGVEIALSVSDSFFQPPTPERRYDGELEESSEGITLTLDDKLLQDPRWQSFAETGLLEVQWQGNELLLRGISPKALRGGSGGKRDRYPSDCCKTCLFYRNRYCRNEHSPLESVRVLPDSYCSQFKRINNFPQRHQDEQT